MVDDIAMIASGALVGEWLFFLFARRNFAWEYKVGRFGVFVHFGFPSGIIR